jgi:serpin B
MLTTGNSRFAVDMYHKLGKEYTNVFFSPYSVSLALAMTYAGAKGETATQMEEALSFPLQGSALHRTFNAIDCSLMKAGRPDSGVELSIVNTTWGQTGMPFKPGYLETIARYYGAGLNLLDFSSEPETCRGIINDWVYQETNELIEDLLPPGSITSLTRFVLTNAIYFFGQWKHTFDTSATEKADFFTTHGERVQVDMMHHPEASFLYSAGPSYQALQLPYQNDRLAMLLILPETGSFSDVEQDITLDFIEQVTTDLDSTMVEVEIPRFEFTTPAINMSGMLKSLGMIKPFTPDADFSGIDSSGNPLYISEVYHKAYIKVYEEGTEAAAATAVVMRTTSIGPHTPLIFRADRPFVFCIRDTKTNTILFMGRVEDPGEM